VRTRRTMSTSLQMGRGPRSARTRREGWSTPSAEEGQGCRVAAKEAEDPKNKAKKGKKGDKEGRRQGRQLHHPAAAEHHQLSPCLVRG